MRVQQILSFYGKDTDPFYYTGQMILTDIKHLLLSLTILFAGVMAHMHVDGLECGEAIVMISVGTLTLVSAVISISIGVVRSAMNKE